MAKSIFEHRLISALILCLSGLALLPFDVLPSRVFGWEQMAGVYDMIFADGFEVGNTKAWKEAALENLRVFPTHDQVAFRQDYRLDRDLVSRFAGKGVILVAGFTGTGDPVFSAEARSTERGLEVRLGAALDGGRWLETEWQVLEGGPLLGVEWQQGHSLARDGFLYLSIDGELTAWLTDLDNDSLQLEMTAISRSGARTVLIPTTSAH